MNLERNFISIIIEIFNRKITTKKFLNSINHQPFKNYEIIIYEDNSKNDSLLRVKKVSIEEIIFP